MYQYRRSLSHKVTTRAIFLRLPGLAPDRRGSKEGDHPTIYIYIASDRIEIRSITVGLAGARPNHDSGDVDLLTEASLRLGPNNILKGGISHHK